MAFHGELRDRENVGDLAVAAALPDQREDLALAARERGQGHTGIDPSLRPSECVQYVGEVVAWECDLPRSCLPHDPGEDGRLHCPLDDAAGARPHDGEDDFAVRSSRDRNGFGHRCPSLDARDRLDSTTRGKIDVSEHDRRPEPVDQADEHLGGRSRNGAYVCLAREHFDDAGPKYAVRVGNDYYKLPAIQSATTFERLASAIDQTRWRPPPTSCRTRRSTQPRAPSSISVAVQNAVRRRSR